jgi:hypothetical protein
MADLANYETQIRGYNYGLHMIGTKLTFDHQTAYPRVLYEAVRLLTEEEFTAVMQVRDALHPRTGNVIPIRKEAPATQERPGA